MGLRQTRTEAHDAVLKGVFIENTLKNHAQEIDNEIRKRQTGAGFQSSFWKKRNFTTKANEMVYTHLKQHRYIDMRTRRNESGIINQKKHYPHHNKVLYGYANNLIRELAYGFVASIKEEMQQLIEQKKL